MSKEMDDLITALDDDPIERVLDAKYNIVEDATSHPMEAILDIEPNTTMIEHSERVEGELVKADGYDEKDDEIDRGMQEVFDAAMTAFENAQSDENITQARGPAASPAEVGNMFLNTALNAMKAKSSVKMHKDKMEVNANKTSAPKNLTQNVIVADRNDILKRLMDTQPKPDKDDE